MPLPQEVTERILANLEAGILPAASPMKMYAGKGRGQTCSGCDERILPEEVEYEMEYGVDSIIRLHLACAGLWEAERKRREQRVTS